MIKRKEGIAHCPNAAQKTDELPAERSIPETADIIVSAWQGALMQAKVMRSRTPIDNFRTWISQERLK